MYIRLHATFQASPLQALLIDRRWETQAFSSFEGEELEICVEEIEPTVYEVKLHVQSDTDTLFSGFNDAIFHLYHRATILSFTAIEYHGRDKPLRRFLVNTSTDPSPFLIDNFCGKKRGLSNNFFYSHLQDPPIPADDIAKTMITPVFGEEKQLQVPSILIPGIMNSSSYFVEKNQPISVCESCQHRLPCVTGSKKTCTYEKRN